VDDDVVEEVEDLEEVEVVEDVVEDEEEDWRLVDWVVEELEADAVEVEEVVCDVVDVCD
jgi:hypothetical protein